MRPWYRLCRFGCQVLYTFFWRGRIFGRRNVPLTGGVLLVSNHQSFLDPMLVTHGLGRECHYMARDSLFRSAFFARLIGSLNAFPVKRATADVGAIKETLRRLKHGELVTVFPEGTRTPDGRLQPMQPGVVLLARKARVPLVPALVLGAFESWPRQALLPRPQPIIVAYAEPLWPHESDKMTGDECIRIVRQRIQGLMDRYRRHPALAGRLQPQGGRGSGSCGG